MHAGGSSSSSDDEDGDAHMAEELNAESLAVYGAVSASPRDYGAHIALVTALRQ